METENEKELKVTAAKCLDGRNHFWSEAYSWQSGGYVHKWCHKCGSLTKFYDGRRVVRGGEQYIVTPDCIEEV